MEKIILLLTLFVVSSLFAQSELSKDYDYQVSRPYRVVDAGGKDYFSNGKEILSIKTRAKTTEKFQILLQKYNVDKMVEIGKNGYNDFPNNFIFENLVEAQGKYYFFYSSWTGRKTKHERLFYREIDFDKGTFIGDSKQIIDYDGYLVDFYTTDGFYLTSFGSSKFDISKSEDGSKILIQDRKKPTVKKDTKSWDKIIVSVFDTNLNELWKKNYTMPYTERKMDFLDGLIDNDGNVFMAIKVYHDDSNKDKKRKDKKANYHIELFAMNNSIDKIETSKISLEDKFINGISMTQSSNKEIILAGYYNNGKIFGNADGVYTYKINHQGNFVDKHFYEIPLEILNQYVSKKVKTKNIKKDKKGKAEAQSLELKHIIANSDGSITLIGEKSFVTVYTNNKTGRTTYTYHYKDILISKIDANGNLSWMKKVPKRQRGRKGKGGMSYSYFYANGNHYLIYLDNIKNINLPIDKKPALHMDGKGGFLTATKINNETGESTKGNILDFRNIKGGIVAYQFDTDRITKIKDNSFFVEVYKKKKEDIFIKVEMKN